MATLVVGNESPVLFLNDGTLSLRTHDDLVAGVVNVLGCHGDITGCGAVQGSLIDEVC